jgi:glycosyltransferase involved in cell wall biosynthesis
VVSQHFFSGDARLAAQVAALRAAGLEVDVLCTRRPSESWIAREGPVRLFRLPSLARRRAGVLRYVAEYASFFVLCALALAILQSRRRYRVVHVTNLPDPLILAAAVPKAAGAKLIFDVRECTPEMVIDRFDAPVDGRLVAVMSRIEQACIRFADAVLTCTEPMRQALVRRGADQNKIEVMLNVGPERLPRPDPVVSAVDSDSIATFRIITHGTIIRRYGHETLIRALAQVVGRVPGAQLEVLGDGPLRPELERLVDALGLRSHVDFAGYVDDREMVRRLGHADCGVVPVLRNPESDLVHTIKMFEYLDLGVPVVISRTTAVAAYFTEEEMRFVEPGDPESLADALIELAQLPERRRHLGAAGQRAFERYGPARQRANYVRLVHRLLAGHPANAKPDRARTGIAAVVWAPYERRTALFAEQLGATFHPIHWLLYKRPWVAPVKYVGQWLRTWQLLAIERPAAIYVTNPPVFAALCVAAYAALTRTPFVMDTHPPALYSRKWSWTLPLQRALARRAVVNVVDQERFSKSFESWGARALVVGNPPLPVRRHPPPNAVGDGPFEIAVVNTFAADEPLAPILEAARRMPDVTFSVLGDTARARGAILAQAPPNLTFTGYLEGEAYWQCLARARAVMALTSFPHSVLGGAHDGVAVGRPLLLSDQPGLREHFPQGAVFADNTAEGLVAGIGTLRGLESRLRVEVGDLRAEQVQRWDRQFAALLEDLTRAGVRVASPERLRDDRTSELPRAC